MPPPSLMYYHYCYVPLTCLLEECLISDLLEPVDPAFLLQTLTVEWRPDSLGVSRKHFAPHRITNQTLPL